jgi:hypothetical protein
MKWWADWLADNSRDHARCPGLTVVRWRRLYGNALVFKVCAVAFVQDQFAGIVCADDDNSEASCLHLFTPAYEDDTECSVVVRCIDPLLTCLASGDKHPVSLTVNTLSGDGTNDVDVYHAQ